MRDVPTVLATLATFPDEDHSEHGPVEVVPLSKVQRLTGAVLGRNWATIPHVTHQDELDVTEAEERRAAWNLANPDARLTPVAMQVAALARALRDHPRMNASLSGDGKAFVMKGYVGVGVAVDTSRGLLVPVLRDADRRSLSELAAALAALAERARGSGLTVAEMSGGTMTLSSLGHIGGTGFTPIINGTQVAILGTTAIRTRATPGTDGGVVWRRMLPVSLSYDHRAVNGADAARFVRSVGAALADPGLFE